MLMLNVVQPSKLARLPAVLSFANRSFAWFQVESEIACPYNGKKMKGLRMAEGLQGWRDDQHMPAACSPSSLIEDASNRVDHSACNICTGKHKN